MPSRTKVEGANLYLVLKIGDAINLEFGGQIAKITAAEFDGKSAVRLAISAPKSIQISRSKYIPKLIKIFRVKEHGA